MRNILILEDKKIHIEALRRIVLEVSSDVRIFETANVIEACRIAVDNHIHLFLVDIILNPNKPGDVQGLQFAENIRRVGRYEFTPLVFITALEDPKYESYSKLNCLSYIEKPFNEEKVKAIIRKALRFPIQDGGEKVIYFRKDGIMYAKCINDIIWIEIHRRNATVYCKSDVLDIPYKTRDEFLKELNSSMFVQCSRNSIVNRKYIKEIDYVNRYIKMWHVADPVEIGSIMKKRFREAMENI